MPDDVVIIYYSGGKSSGFFGYVVLSDSVSENFDIKNNIKKIKRSIFDNEQMDSYIVSIKKCHLLKKAMKMHDITDNATLIQKVRKEMTMRKEMHEMKQIDDDIGILIRKTIRKKIEEYNEDEKRKQKEKQKSKKENKGDEQSDTEVYVRPVATYSEYLIPILIIPCEKILDKMKKCEPDKKIGMFMRHIHKCKECEMTNNNDRVSLDMIRKCQTKYYKMKDGDEIETVLDFFLGSKYYEMDVEKNNMTLIKFYNKEYNHDKCYCIVGRLNTIF